MDAVTCFDVLEHIPDKETTLSEIFRVLKPGGWLFLDTLNKTTLSKAVVIWLGEVLLRLIPRGTHDWRDFIRPPELQRLLEACGFTQARFAGVRLDWRRHNDGRLPVRNSEGKYGNHVLRISHEARGTGFTREAVLSPPAMILRHRWTPSMASTTQ